MVTLLDFHAEWCAPCSQQDPIVDELEEDYDDDLSVERIDVDEHQERANEYQVRSLPTLIVLDDEDDIADRFVGLTDQDTLEESIESVL